MSAVKCLGLDHVAIAVSELERAIELYRDAFGLPLSEVEEVPEQKTKAAIFGHGRGRVELLCPTVEDSPVARFLKKRGEGLHHLCLEVEDIEAAMAELRAKGAPLIDQVPRPGAGGAKVAFIHPQGCFGVLVELREGPKGQQAN
ncbi:MAG: methylmalonyl-CoA epimerase [Myxococcales bacterium]|nr:methylmalonyl-CoA epimerase [Myxococcales bacterium]